MFLFNWNGFISLQFITSNLDSQLVSNILSTSIEYLKGVGPKRADVLKQEARIFTFWDLLNNFPFRYIDRSQFLNISEVREELGMVQLKGKLIDFKEVGVKRAKRLIAHIEDDSGKIELIWFKGIKWVKPSLRVGDEYIVFGKPTRFGRKFNIAHPEIEPLKQAKHASGRLQAVYHSGDKLTSKGLNSKGFENIIRTLMPQVPNQIPENLSPEIIAKFNLISREQAYFKIHNPRDYRDAKAALLRLKFEELFFLQLLMAKQKQITQSKSRGHVFGEMGDLFNDFYKNHLPFDLTGAQKRVLKEIRKDLRSGVHMNRLLQGDVGSGKTLVALFTIFMALDNGFQAALMAPTEILSIQHYHTIVEFTEKLPIKIALLTGSTKTAERKIIHEQLESGELNLLIGTHALLEDKVKFKNLGLSVIDEQHRFGVAQRARLWKKNTTPPHVLVMTATPIPRTLAMTFYGDLDVSIIDELPPGRKPVTTEHRYDSARLRVFGFMETEIKKGRQVYIVYPLIEESETLDYKDLMDGYESIVRRFPKPNYQISIVHGRMKAADKEHEMERFVKGETHIMVATTVIEVGVNVPNASVMIIESAEKFGLSQLHQLRGRVGRGADQSYCVLMTSYKLTADAKKRLETMVATTDGFVIAEVDLKLRGPGDIMGTQQSGILDLKIADIAKDGQILQHARTAAFNIISSDPDLKQPEHTGIRKQLVRMIKNRPNWSRIS
ncbi:MAG: ATP-dependent DNA helicase RecG [Flavobacteriales bacterium]|nr:ATP-dependent DNA helicase RecG [Flavobacteriales bacterium]